jgi:putative hydrolase of the HAD superfamily
MLNKYSTGEEIFGNTLSFFGTNRTSAELLKWYREHNPQLRLSPAASRALSTIKRRSFKVGLVTDGRSQQQRNKLSSLGLSNYFDDVIISEEFGSEKPDSRNFRYFQDKYGSANYWYIGDNVGKDFLAPNELNWQTICLTDSGNNVHPQSFDHPSKYLPDFKIKSIEESLALIFG